MKEFNVNFVLKTDDSWDINEIKDKISRCFMAYRIEVREIKKPIEESVLGDLYYSPNKD